MYRSSFTHAARAGQPRRVAVKVIPQQKLVHEIARVRFLREARLLPGWNEDFFQQSGLAGVAKGSEPR